MMEIVFKPKKNEELDLEPVLYEKGFILVSNGLGREFDKGNASGSVEQMFSGFKDRLLALKKRYEEKSKAYSKDELDFFKSCHGSRERYVNELVKSYEAGGPVIIGGIRLDYRDGNSDKFGYVYKGFVLIMGTTDGELLIEAKPFDYSTRIVEFEKVDVKVVLPK